MNIKDLDWSSLVVLESLVQQGNVTKVAKKLGLSQPAVSNSLARLRRDFGDSLFIRTRQGMIPTARAKELAEAISKAMQVVGGLTQAQAPFSHKNSDRVFHLAMTDYAEMIIVPPMSNFLSKESSPIRLEIRSLAERIPYADLEEGRVELAVGYFPDAPGSLYQQPLFTEDFVCVGRSEALKKKKSLTLKEFCSFKHILVAPWGGVTGLVDAKLTEQGQTRSVLISTAHFLAAPFIAAETGYLVTLPRRMAIYVAPALKLRVWDLPIELPPMPFRQIWHARTHEDPALKWLRGKIAEQFRA